MSPKNAQRMCLKPLELDLKTARLTARGMKSVNVSTRNHVTFNKFHFEGLGLPGIMWVLTKFMYTLIFPALCLLNLGSINVFGVNTV